MQRKVRLSLIAPLAASAIALAGCGGGSSNNAGGGPKHDKLVAVADPICQRLAEKRAAANASVKAVPGTTGQLKELTQVGPEIAEAEHDAVILLSKLKPSEAEAQEWHAILVGMNALARDTASLVNAAKKNDLSEVHKIDANGQAVRKQLTIIAKRNGFVYCGITT
jgi:hypothetical protein